MSDQHPKNTDQTACTGTTHAVCQSCLRREFWPTPGDRRLWLVQPPIDMLTGHCEMALSPVFRYSTTTALNGDESLPR